MATPVESKCAPKAAPRDVDDDTRRAAGVLFGCGGRIFLGKRSQMCSEPGTWALPGGSCKRGESFLDAAIREAGEEFGCCPAFRVVRTATFTKGPFTYTTFFALVPPDAMRRWRPKLNEEHTDAGWFLPTKLPKDLHPGLAAVLRKLLGPDAVPAS